MWKIVHILLVLFCTTTPIFCYTLWATEQPINHHECDPTPSSTVIISITMGPCKDSFGCVLPYCCGVISGRLTNLTITYEASVNMTTGTRYGEIDSVGVSIGEPGYIPVDPLDIISLYIPLQYLTFDDDACDFTECPQEVGNIYTMHGQFTVKPPLVSSNGVTGDFNARIVADDPGHAVVYCKGIYARILNTDNLSIFG